MADLNIQPVTMAGLAPAFSAASAGGDKFSNDGRTMLYIKNGGGASIIVTIDSRVRCNQGFDHDIQVTVAAGSEKMIGPFEKARFNDADGKVAVAYSDVASVTVAAIRA